MAQCKAKSKQSGNRCRANAIAGATVCRFHGGAAPQVREAARRRLLALVDPAISALGEMVDDRDDFARPTRLGAAKEILTRNGIGETPEINLNVTSEVDLDGRIAELLAKLSGGEASAPGEAGVEGDGETEPDPA